MKLEILYFINRQVLENTPMSISVGTGYNSSSAKVERPIKGLPNKARTLMSTFADVADSDKSSFTAAEMDPLGVIARHMKSISYLLDDLYSYDASIWDWEDLNEAMMHLHAMEQVFGPFIGMSKLTDAVGLCATTMYWLGRKKTEFASDSWAGQLMADAQSTLQYIVVSFNNPHKRLSVCCEAKIVKALSEVDQATGAKLGLCDSCGNTAMITEQLDLNTVASLMSDVIGDLARWITPDRMETLDRMIRTTPLVLSPFATQGRRLLERCSEAVASLDDDVHTVVDGNTIQNWMDYFDLPVEDISNGNVDPETQVNYGETLQMAYKLFNTDKYEFLPKGMAYLRWQIGNYLKAFYPHYMEEVKEEKS